MNWRVAGSTLRSNDRYRRTDAEQDGERIWPAVFLQQWIEAEELGLCISVNWLCKYAGCTQRGHGHGGGTSLLPEKRLGCEFLMRRCHHVASELEARAVAHHITHYSKGVNMTIDGS